MWWFLYLLPSQGKGEQIIRKTSKLWMIDKLLLISPGYLRRVTSFCPKLIPLSQSKGPPLKLNRDQNEEHNLWDILTIPQSLTWSHISENDVHLWKEWYIEKLRGPHNYCYMIPKCTLALRNIIDNPTIWKQKRLPWMIIPFSMHETPAPWTTRLCVSRSIFVAQNTGVQWHRVQNLEETQDDHDSLQGFLHITNKSNSSYLVHTLSYQLVSRLSHSCDPTLCDHHKTPSVFYRNCSICEFICKYEIETIAILVQLLHGKQGKDEVHLRVLTSLLGR